VLPDVHEAANAAELDRAFVAVRNGSAQGLVVTPSPFAADNRDRLVEFAASRRLPAIYFDADFADAGGLMSYGPSTSMPTGAPRRMSTRF
jgi:putative ABC transport system substrate-binding protein